MNRKNKEKENINKDEPDNGPKPGEPIPPKFATNWSQNIKFDKVVINLVGSFTLTQTASTMYLLEWPRS